MYDPTGRIVAGAFAAVLVYLSVTAIRTGIIFGRGIPYRLRDDRSSFVAALIAQIGFAIFLIMIATGYEPLTILRSILRYSGSDASTGCVH